MAERASWAVTGQTAEDGRVAIGALLTPGASAVVAKTGFRPGPGTSPGLVQASGTPDGNVSVAKFQAFLQTSRAGVGGSYIATLDANKTINILSTPADPANPRNDLVIAQQTDTFYGDGSSALTVKQIVGTPSGTPADPAVTGSPDYITLARVRVRANASSILGTDITDLRPTGLHTVAVGGILPVPSQAARDALTGLYDGFAVWRLDRHWLELYDGTVWRVQGQMVAASSSRPPANAGDRLYEPDTGFSYLYKGTKWIRDEYTLEKSSDQPWTSNTTLADVTDLTTTVEANCHYAFTINAAILAGSAGLNIVAVAPAGSRLDFSQNGIVASSGLMYNSFVQNGAATVSLGTYGQGPSNWSNARIEGILSVAGTAGTFKLQASQGTSSGVTSWLARGSILRLRQVS